MAVYRTRCTLSEADLAASILLTFGMIDDEGWVYVNGQAAGESHDWNLPPSFAPRKFLHAGENTIAVVVNNKEGSGGVGKSASLELQDKPVPVVWKRSVFNGLAQLIVQSAKEPGELQLTARSEGLAPATLSLRAQPCAARPTAP